MNLKKSCELKEIIKSECTDILWAINNMYVLRPKNHKIGEPRPWQVCATFKKTGTHIKFRSFEEYAIFKKAEEKEKK